MAKQRRARRDRGPWGFYGGVQQLGESVWPGLGAFIEQCVRESMTRHGAIYEEQEKAVTRGATSCPPERRIY